MGENFFYKKKSQKPAVNRICGTGGWLLEGAALGHMGWPFGASRRRLGKSGRAGRDWKGWKIFPGATIPAEVKNGRASNSGKIWKCWKILEAEKKICCTGKNWKSGPVRWCAARPQFPVFGNIGLKKMGWKANPNFYSPIISLEIFTQSG